MPHTLATLLLLLLLLFELVCCAWLPWAGMVVGLSVVVEDALGDTAAAVFYNLLPSAQISKARDRRQKIPVGSTVWIKEPYYKMMNSGTLGECC